MEIKYKIQNKRERYNMAIKVSELKELRKKMDGVISVKLEGLEFEVKKYLPVEQKLTLAQIIYESAKEDSSDGLFAVNQNSINIATIYHVTNQYTNIGLPKDYFEGFDLIAQLGIYGKIEEVIKNELDVINAMVKNIATKENELDSKRGQVGYAISSGLKGLDIGSVMQMLDFEGLKGLTGNEDK